MQIWKRKEKNEEKKKNWRDKRRRNAVEYTKEKKWNFKCEIVERFEYKKMDWDALQMNWLHNE